MSMALCLVRFRFTRMTRAPRLTVFSGVSWISRALRLTMLKKIVLTGLGSTYFHENIFGIPTIHALELDAIGHGGLYLSGLDEALVVSLGTGSAFIRASRTNGFRHLGGSGVGGGTLAGMAERFRRHRHFCPLRDGAARQ